MSIVRALLWFAVASLLFCGPPQASTDQATEQASLTPVEIAQPGEETAAPSNVYYRQTNIQALAPQPINLVRHPDPTVMAKHLIDLLSIQPESVAFEPIWPSNTFVRELYLLSDGTIVVDFDRRFVDSISAGATLEEEMIVSLVLTLLDNFEEFVQVRILVDGAPQETFLGHVDIEKALNRKTKVYTVIPEGKPGDEIIVEDLSGKDSGNKP